MLILLASLLITAFFSGMEIAFISADKLRYELDKKTKNLPSLFLSPIFKNPEKFIAALSVGNILGLVIFCLQTSIILYQPLQEIWNNSIFILLAQISICTLSILLIGEFLPRTIFRINSNSWLNSFAIPLWLSYIALYPLTKITDGISKAILRAFGIKVSLEKKQQIFNRNNLSLWVQENSENKTDNEELEHEVQIFQNALDFSSVKLKDCMVPRTEIVALEVNVELNVLIAKFTETGYSKIVIYEKDIDHILGYIHSSEMFANAAHWTKKIQSMPVVPETMQANKLLGTLMQQKKSMALIVDEFGGCSGIITLEDIIEEIFGEIEDEHDNKKLIARKISESEYILSARMEIDFLNQEYNLNIPESDDYVSLAGYIFYNYQNFPKLNEIIKIDQFEIKILKVSNNKIELVRLKTIL